MENLLDPYFLFGVHSTIDLEESMILLLGPRERETTKEKKTKDRVFRINSLFFLFSRRLFLKRNIIAKLITVGAIIFISGLFLNSNKEKSLSLKPEIRTRFSIQSPFLSQGEQQKESPDLCLIQNNVLIAATPPIAVTPQILASLIMGSSNTIASIPKTRDEIVEYTAEEGDTLSGIARRFGISLNTLIWVNSLRKNSVIHPGQKFTILPVDGLIHIVKKGDTLGDIAKRYKADQKEIADINGLLSSDEIFENQALIIPHGVMPSVSQYKENSYNGLLSTNDFYGLSYHYPYGQCTYWVAQKRAIPSNWGNAISWLDNAIKDGYSVCKGSYCKPQVGAVISMKGNSWMGHVAYVEEIRGNRVIFSEMNGWRGLGKADRRFLRIGDPRIFGYIYK